MSKQPKQWCAIFIFIHLMVPPLAATATPLDSNFGADGVATAYVGTHGSTPRKIALQADGKIVICGWALNYQSSGSYGYDVGLVRFDSDGNLDTTFGVGGKVSTDIGSSHPVYTDDRGDAMVIQPDNKIVVAGTTRRYTKSGSASFQWYQWDVLLLRYLEDGTLDKDFGNNGQVVIDLKDTGSVPEGFNDVALQSDHKIIAAGYTYPGNNRFLIMRFHPNGAVDTSFGAAGTGIVEEHFTPNTLEDAYSVLVLPDDSMVVLGRGIKPDGNSTLSMLKLTPAGRLDSSFNGSGKIAMSVGVSSEGWNLAADGTGRIVVAGGYKVSAYGSYQALVLRYRSNGTLDPSFNGTGVFATSFGDSFDVRMRSVNLEDDDSIMVAGFAGNSSSGIVARLRLAANGTPDESFAPGGRATTALGGTSLYSVCNGTLQPDGKLLIGVNHQTATGIPFAALRYKAAGEGSQIDGIPMDWINAHFGSAENAPEEVCKGGLTVSLLEAYLMGDDPLDPNDCIRASCFIPNDATIQIDFPTLIGRAYQVESSADMFADSWIPTGDRMLGDGSVAHVLIPKETFKRFFRVSVSLP